MQPLIEKALESGNAVIVLILIVAVAMRDLTPWIFRKIQNRNGASTVRGQIDQVLERLKELSTIREHLDSLRILVTRHDERIIQHDREIQNIQDEQIAWRKSEK